MELVAAALGDGVDDATSRTAILSGVVGGVDLKLLNGGLCGGVTGAGTATLFREVGLVVVGAVDGYVVEEGALTAEAQEPEATGVADDGRCEQSIGRPAVVVYGKIPEDTLLDETA